MEVELTRDQQSLVRQAIAAGRLHDPREAAEEAFSLWEERERRRAEIPASVNIAEESVMRGEGRVIAEASIHQLARDADPRGHHAPALDWSQCAAVESIPGKVGGAWVFRDTRMPVAAVFENLEDGVTIEELTGLYAGLTREQINAVLDFAARSLHAPAHSC